MKQLAAAILATLVAGAAIVADAATDSLGFRPAASRATTTTVAPAQNP